MKKVRRITIFLLFISASLIIFFPDIKYNIAEGFSDIYRLIIEIGDSLLGGILLNYIVAFLVHFCAYKKVGYSLDDRKSKIIFNSGNFLGILISPDYLLAKYYKNRLPNSRRGEIIKYSNWINISFMSFVATVLLFRINDIFLFLKIFFIFHLISRVTEISYAFYKDIVDESEKKSSLKANERVELAVYSYFEIIILYATIYYLFKNNHTLFLESLIYSAKINVFIFSLSDETLRSQFVSLSQIFASLNLVVLSIATYLGSKIPRH